MQASKRQVEDTLHLVQYLLIHKNHVGHGYTKQWCTIHTASSEQTGISIQCSQVSLKIYVPEAA